MNYIIIVMIKRLLLSLYHLFHQKNEHFDNRKLVPNMVPFLNSGIIWTVNFRSAGGFPGSPGTYYTLTGADEQILFFLL